MKKLVMLLSVVLSLVAATASAQSATGLNKVGWDQTAPDVTTAQAYSFKHYDDGAVTGTTFTTVVTCADKVPAVVGVFDCSTAFPAFTPGTHTMTLTASNIAGESPKSVVLTFRFEVKPVEPKNLRIQ